MLGEKEIFKVAFYIRVSTEEQVREWYGIEYQQDALQKVIDFRKDQFPMWTTDKKHWYIDDWKSWGDLNRPAFQKMMEAAKKQEFDIVAVWKIDRLSRNLTHLLKTFEDLRKYWVSFYSLKENIDFSGPVWRLTFQIFWALAEFEREMIKSRTTEWKIASARRWNYIWYGIPYGYDRDTSHTQKWTRLKIVPEEAEIVKSIFHWYLHEDYHFAKIENKLNELWIKKWVASRKRYMNSKWSQSTIKGMLQNTTYMGERIDNLKTDDGSIEQIPVRTPAIIDEATFEFVQAKIINWEENERGNKNGWGKNEYLLSRMILDPESGRKMIGTKRQDGSFGYRRKGYKDTFWVWHKNIDIPGESLDNFVWWIVTQQIKNPDKFYLLFKKQVESGENIEKLKDEILKYEKILEAKEQAIINMESDYYEKGNISEERLKEHTEKYNTDIENIKKEIVINETKLSGLLKLKYSKDAMKIMSEKYKNNIENLSLKEKQFILNALIDVIIVSKEDNDDVKVSIKFKFDLSKIEKKQIEDEFKKSTNKGKTKGAKYVSCINGEVL